MELRLRVRCGTADLLGVCDVKDLMGFTLESISPGSDFSAQPRIPEAAIIYCTLRANFALLRLVLHEALALVSPRRSRCDKLVTTWDAEMAKNIISFFMLLKKISFRKTL